MTKSEQKKVFRIIDNPADDARHPYALLDPDDVIIRIDVRPRYLADWAFDTLSADEVVHEEDVFRADQL